MSDDLMIEPVGCTTYPEWFIVRYLTPDSGGNFETNLAGFEEHSPWSLTDKLVCGVLDTETNWANDNVCVFMGFADNECGTHDLVLIYESDDHYFRNTFRYSHDGLDSLESEVMNALPPNVIRALNTENCPTFISELVGYLREAYLKITIC